MQMKRASTISVKSTFLIMGGLISASAAIWHLLMIAGGPAWYAFARAPFYIVKSAENGTLVAPIGAVAIAALMFICSIYAFSGAGIIRKIPLLKSALVTISLICLIRGIFISPLFYSIKVLGTWHLIASSTWFFVGICFLLGATQQFSDKE